MIESFVDLTYRGLSLGRRIRLSQVRPGSGYLELPAPMPVGTQIAIATDDGVGFDATVTQLHEQVGGSDRPPGMTVAPALTAGPAAAWWSARVVLPDDEAARARPTGAGAAADPASPGRSAASVHDAPTVAMPALELPAEAFPEPSAADGPAAADPTGGRSTGEHDVIDDGKRTMIMAPLDLATLGLDPATGAAAAASDGADDDDGDEADAEADAGAGEPATDPDGSALQLSEPPPMSPSSPASPASPTSPTSGRGRKKRRLRR